MKEEGVRMVFQLTGLQRNTCRNVDENKRMEEGAQFCSFDFRKKQIVFLWNRKPL